MHPAAQARRVPHQAVPLPQALPQPQARPHGLHQAAARAARAAGREKGLRALGYTLRLHHGRPARRGLHPRAFRTPCVGPAARGARACLRQRACPHGKAWTRRVPGILRRVQAHQQAAGPGAVRGALPHLVTPRLYHGRRNRPGRGRARHGLHARAGERLLPHALHPVHRHVLHRP